VLVERHLQPTITALRIVEEAVGRPGSVARMSST